MANVSPVTQGTTGYAPPGSIWSELDSGGGMANTEVVTTVGQVIPSAGVTFTSFYISSVGDGDQWNGSSTTPPPKRPVAVWCKGDDVDDDLVNAYIVTVGEVGTDTVIEFQTNGAAKSVHVLVAHRS